MIRKEIMIVLITFCLTATLFSIIPVGSQGVREYDPWYDMNDDGIIDLWDVYHMNMKYGAEGVPINKTDLLLELQSRIENLEARTPSKGYISISPSAFQPESNTQSYYNGFNYLYGQGNFYANLQLPDGATIKNITAHMHDHVTNGLVYIVLFGYNATKGQFLTIPMAQVSSSLSGAPGFAVLYDDTIADAKIDTKNCIYSMYVQFTYSSTDLELWSIRIEYGY